MSDKNLFNNADVNDYTNATSRAGQSFKPGEALGDTLTGSTEGNFGKTAVKPGGVDQTVSSDRTGNTRDTNIKLDAVNNSAFGQPNPKVPPAPERPEPPVKPAEAPAAPINPTQTTAGTSSPIKPAQPTMTPTTDNILKLIPSKKQISEMSREELINLRSFLIKHCYKEAVQTYDIYNVKRFAKECFKTHNMIPVVLNQYYPDVITDNIQKVYTKLLELSNVEGNGENIKNAVQTQLDYTMKLFSTSTDWIGIVLSKKLGEWSPFFKNTTMENMTIGKFFMVAALCASIVYLVKKFFKSKYFLGIGDKYDFSDSTNRVYFDSRMKNFKEDVDAKLKEYMSKDIPTDVLMINSIILKAEAMSLGLLLSVAYQNLDEYNIPLNILVLTEVCCSMVLLWDKLLGRKLKKSKSTSNLYDVISDKLSVSMGVNPNNPSRDIFSKLNKYSRSLSNEK